MKKILILLFIFVLPLFSEFSLYSDGFGIETRDTFDDIDFKLFAFTHDNKDRILISISSPERPKYMYIDSLFFSLDGDKGVRYENGYYTIVIGDKTSLKHILQKITQGEDINILTETDSYFFEFYKYKKDIIKNNFYKKIMEQ